MSINEKPIILFVIPEKSDLSSLCYKYSNLSCYKTSIELTFVTLTHVFYIKKIYMKTHQHIKTEILILFILFGFSSLSPAQKNRYGMSLSRTSDSYTLTDAAKICPLITGGCDALPADVYTLYAGYQPELISDNDYAYCTTLKYTFKTYSTYSLSLEVDIPKLTTGPHPFIIWVHGGGWTNGGTTAFIDQSQYLASRGIAGVRLTYSVISQGGNFNLGMQELADAFAFIHEHATEWGLDMTRFGYAGGSAGTPLASLAAMKHNGNGCKLFMGCNGIYDFQNNLAGGFGSGSSPYLVDYPTKESRGVISAINYIPSNPDNVPAVALFHGTADFTISYLQSVELYDSIISKGGRAENNIYDYYVHAFFNRGSSDMYENVTLKLYAFAKSVFGTPNVTLPAPSQSVIARFLFTTGENQAKPTDVAKGVTVSDFQTGSAISSSFVGNAIQTQGWGGFNIWGNKYVGFEIKSNPTCSFKVNNIDLKMKKSTSTLTANGIFNYGTTFPPTTTKGVQKNGIATTDYSTISLLPNATTLAQTDANLCFGIGISTGTSTTEVISFDEITIYGEVKKPIITVSTLTPSQTSININAIKDHPVVIPITVFGELIENTVEVTIENDNDHVFSVDRNYATVTELANGLQLNVSFPAANYGTYNATLKLQSDEVSLSIPIQVVCDIFFEDFSNIVGTSSTVVSELNPIPTNLPQAKTTGWEGYRMYEYRAGSPNLGSVCLGSTNDELAYMKTPFINLNLPYVLKFKARSLVLGTPRGNFTILSDSSGLIYNNSNTTSTMISYTTEPIVGSLNNRFTFLGEKDENSNIIFDSIYVAPTSLPAINLGLIKEISLGTVVQNTQKTIDIPLLGFNLLNNVSLSMKSGNQFSIITPTTLSANTVQNGTIISIQFNSPTTASGYSDTLMVSSPDFITRKVSINAETESVSGLLNLHSGKICTEQNTICFNNLSGNNIMIFNSVGQLIIQKNIQSEKENTIPLKSGIYIVKVINQSHYIQKVII